MLVNFHCHSTLSSDASSTMPEMARAARDAGIEVLCMTTTATCCPMTGGKFERFSWEKSEARYAEACAAVPGYDLRLGIELGSSFYDPAKAEKILSHQHVDFVIGSAHNFPGGPDYYYGDIRVPRPVSAGPGRVFRPGADARPLPLLRRVGHLDYPVRYMRLQGQDVSLSPQHPTVQAIFRAVIDSVPGHRVQYLGLPGGGRSTFPSRDLLAAYRAAGGRAPDHRHRCPPHRSNRPGPQRELSDAPGHRLYRADHLPGPGPEQIKLEA